MRKGFTMIELIFVIVILGVLASVAIPRLAATRDDAEVAKAATNLTTAISDIAAYYTAHGDFKKKSGNTRTEVSFKEMTNALDNLDKSKKLEGYISLKNTKCLKITAVESTYDSTKKTTSSAMIKVEPADAKNNDGACKTLMSLSGVKSMCGGNEITSGATSSKGCTIKVGGKSVIKF